MLPVLFRLGPITIYSFGFFLFLGFLLACFVVWKQAKERGLSQEKVLDNLFSTVLLSLLVGRLVFVLTFWQTFSADWSRVILFSKYAGISFPALLISLIIFSAFFAWQSGIEVLWFWDILALAGAFLAVFGNFGCFLDGCFVPLPGLALGLTALAGLLVFWLSFLSRKFVSSANFAELAKKRGLFFLCYLIFQLTSLLMAAWLSHDQWLAAAYAAGLVFVIIVLVFRYRLMFRRYGSIS